MSQGRATSHVPHFERPDHKCYHLPTAVLSAVRASCDQVFKAVAIRGDRISHGL